MLTELFLKGRLRHDLSSCERQALEDCISKTLILEPRETLVRRGERVSSSYFLVEGTMLRHIDDQRGERQLVGVSLPGDFVDLHAYAMKRLDHDIASLTRCVLAQMPHGRLSELIGNRPHLGRALWFSTLLDAAMHREWIFGLGRLDAEGRVAHLILELIERLRLIDSYHDEILAAPLTQRDYAEACGITPVHANRIFRSLRERGALLTHRDGRLQILDEAMLRELAEFDSAYLYGSGELALDSLRES